MEQVAGKEKRLILAFTERLYSKRSGERKEWMKIWIGKMQHRGYGNFA